MTKNSELLMYLGVKIQQIMVLKFFEDEIHLIPFYLIQNPQLIIWMPFKIKIILPYARFPNKPLNGNTVAVNQPISYTIKTILKNPEKLY